MKLLKWPHLSGYDLNAYLNMALLVGLIIWIWHHETTKFLKVGTTYPPQSAAEESCLKGCGSEVPLLGVGRKPKCFCYNKGTNSIHELEIWL